MRSGQSSETIRMTEVLFVLPQHDQLQARRYDNDPTENGIKYGPVWWDIGSAKGGGGLGYHQWRNGNGRGWGWPCYYGRSDEQYGEPKFWW